MSVTRWILDKDGDREYTFPRNPDRYGGDTYWNYSPKLSIINVIGASFGRMHFQGFDNATRDIRFTAITGTMKRRLEDFYLSKRQINNCRDHLYPTTLDFNCYIIAFNAELRPTLNSEDTWNVTMTLMKVI